MEKLLAIETSRQLAADGQTVHIFPDGSCSTSTSSKHFLGGTFDGGGIEENDYTLLASPPQANLKCVSPIK